MLEYQAYVACQARKLTLHKGQIEKHDRAFKKVLLPRLTLHDISWANKSVLCLGARLGAEVSVFRSLGCFAVGVDLNPGLDNPYVLWGDFHALAFPTGCVDVVFTNSLDHSLDIDLVLLQIYQVLRCEGFFVIEIVKGAEEGYTPDKYDISHWSRVEDVIELITKAGFTEVRRFGFVDPWPGVHVLWKKCK